jgi:hypothetical protein
MITLNLTATAADEIIIKDYLENNAGEVLAEKINNGVRIEKDGEVFINKKTLSTFMSYAHDEAKKLLAKGARVAMVEHSTVYNWAIHYFEEDSIEGTLYNLDGTEHKPVVKTHVKPTATKPSASELPKARKQSFFDLINEQKLEDFNLEEEPEEVIEQEEEPEVKEEQTRDDESSNRISNILIRIFGDALKVEVGA